MKNLLKFVIILFISSLVEIPQPDDIYYTHNALLLLATLAAKTRLLLVPTTTLATDAYHDINNFFLSLQHTEKTAD